MAKKNGSTALTPHVVPPEGEALATALPSFIDTADRTGTDDITSEDLRLPRLLIAQGLSSQLVPGGSNYIEGLKLFDLFNDLTGEVYGSGPFQFIVVKRDTRRIEFDENRNIVDLDVPKYDPRTTWTVSNDGKRVPPRATEFVEFVILLLLPDRATPEPIVLSIKTTNKWNRRAAERLTGFIKLPLHGVNAPIFGKLYTVASKPEKNDQGTFGVYVINQAGFVQDERLYLQAKKFRESIEGKTIVVQREPDDSGTAPGGPVADGDIPF